MAFNYSPKIVTDGLVLYLDAANTKSYTSGSTTWNDISRGGNNGTLTNDPTFSSANGGSVVFDGSNDYILGTSISSGSYMNGFTVMSFHKLTSTGNYPTIFGLAKIPGFQFGAINIGYQANLGRIQSYLITTSTSYQTLLTPNTLNKITCVTATWDGLSVNGSLKFYINNNLELTTTTQGTLNSTDASTVYRVGNRGGLDIPFVGNIYNVQLYNRALSSTEVLQNYNALKGRFNL
jgi:hypothetical protein